MQYIVTYEVTSTITVRRNLDDNTDKAFEEAIKIAERNPHYIPESVTMTPMDGSGTFTY